ncbi:MAG: helix-turn-helix domain-containing protein, partial [Actinomycetota bacterium]|nr:helix-turn-helix domain-containing protein [Actinomycetota bacterium]
MATHRDERFFASTRGQVVTLLRRSARTVEDLARVLGLTDNGIRAHLAALERDGIVRQRGVVRRGSGKPAYVYGLTSQAEGLFPKAYGPVLRELLDVLAERVGPEETEALLRAVGSRLADGRDLPAGGGIRARLEAG